MCFFDTVWKYRPDRVPLAEDITGLSIRNGTKEKTVNLNGVSFDCIPGFIIALGTLIAIRDNLKEGKVEKVTTSLTRGANLLHEVTDICAKNPKITAKTSVSDKSLDNYFLQSRTYVDTKAIGKAGFPAEATFNTKYSHLEENMTFSDGNKDFNSK